MNKNSIPRYNDGGSGHRYKKSTVVIISRNIHISTDKGWATFRVDVCFPLSLPKLQVSHKKQDLLTIRQYMRSPPCLDGVSVAHIFSCLYYLIVCLHVFSSVL